VPGGGGGGGTTTFPLTGAASGGAAPGTTFDGSVARTFDAHTLGGCLLTGCTMTGGLLAPSLGATGPDPVVNYPSNPTHTCTAGDLYNNAGTPTFCPATTPVALQLIPTIAIKKGSASGTNYTTTSTTWVVVDGTNLSNAVLVPTGYKLTISATVNVLTPNNGTAISMFDGATEIGGTEVYTVIGSANTALYMALPSQAVITGDGATHTITLRYESPNGGTSAALNSTTNFPTMIFRLEQSN